jgi:Uma2 family endonuclease
MNAIPIPSTVLYAPDHTQLPHKDGKPVNNAQEHPQSRLLTGSIEPTLMKRHPDGRYFIGEDVGIYFRLTDPPLSGCRAPDWFYVPDVEPTVGGQFRGSFVLWRERGAPVLVIEYAVGDAPEERDTTPETGKFWIYEQAIRVPYYAIFEIETGNLDVYQLVAGSYQRLEPNAHGRVLIPPVGLELGVWDGRYGQNEAHWLRWWDEQGNVLPSPEEREKRQHERAERLAAKLREMGVDPDQI